MRPSQEWFGLKSARTVHETRYSEIGGRDMTYTTVLSSRVGDLQGMLGEWSDWTKDHVLSTSSALGVALSQTMVGGERAGEVNASFQWDSIDQAMTGIATLTESAQLAEMYASYGVAPVRRSMAKVLAQRGSREGQCMSLLMCSGNSIDEATAASNADLLWDGLSSAANGYAINQVIAGGEFTGMYALTTWTDSLASFMEAATATNSSAPVQQMMSNQNIRFVSRSLSRIL